MIFVPTESFHFCLPAFDPVVMQLEEERCKERFNILDEIFRTLSMAGLIYSLYSCHGYYVLGVCVVTSLSILDVFKLYGMTEKQSEVSVNYVKNTFGHFELILRRTPF